MSAKIIDTFENNEEKPSEITPALEKKDTPDDISCENKEILQEVVNCLTEAQEKTQSNIIELNNTESIIELTDPETTEQSILVNDTLDEPISELPEIKSVKEARSIIEALLYATKDPLSVKKISKLLNGLEEHIIRQLLLELQIEYDNSMCGLMIQEIAGGYIMATRKKFAPWIKQLFSQRQRNPLTPSAMETLSIIAYKQPITRAEIEAIRGVDSSAMVRNLQEIELIDVVGKKDVIGKPSLYGTTEQFLKVFGLKSLSNLPSIDEIRKRITE